MLNLLRKALRNPWILNVLVLLAWAALLWPFFLDVYNALGLYKSSGEAGNHAVIIEDNAELFSPEERSKLEWEMTKAARFCSVALLTTRDTGDNSHPVYANRAFDRLFSKRDAILFLIDLDNHKLRLQKNEGNQLLTTALCESITDNVYRYASDGDYYACAKNAFSQAAAVMSGEQIPQPMKHVSNLLIALCLGLMTAFWAAYRQNDVNRPDEVYQINRKAFRSISFTDGDLREVDSANYAGTLGKIILILFRILAAAGGSGSSGRSRSGSSGSSGRSSSGGGSSGGGSSGGSHRF